MSGTTAADTEFRDRRQARRLARRAALAVLIAGALTVAWGAVLPWARLTIFGVAMNVPGVAGWGALTVFAAFVALVFGRRYPLVAVACGLLALGLGAQAHKETGRALRLRTLALEQSLAPVNDRLMRIGLPPVEPFPPGQRRADLLGPGPLWTAWGGAVLALGAALRFAAVRSGGSCPRCHAAWRIAERDGEAARIAFCPSCGERVGPRVVCPACRAPVLDADAFCAACGTAL